MAVERDRLGAFLHVPKKYGLVAGACEDLGVPHKAQVADSEELHLSLAASLLPDGASAAWIPIAQTGSSRSANCSSPAVSHRRLPNQHP
ncbi:hypothetical protein OGATHE_000979 [Ogataea polymorpha]|uniref:Uncharacterized protein n=1 Tax=Ogataea polymorpha TaxID=460523 RepID=A0A9P8PTV4_9ASCO|nr:hypothetical protein OGATHE_000979 [Ogataea polymorpha]